LLRSEVSQSCDAGGGARLRFAPAPGPGMVHFPGDAHPPFSPRVAAGGMDRRGEGGVGRIRHHPAGRGCADPARGGRPRPIPRGGRGPDGLAGEGEGGRRSPRRGRRTSGRDDGGRRNRLRDRARISPRDRGGRRGRHAFLSRGRVGVGMAAWLFHFALVAYAVAAVRHLATVVRDRKESAAWADRAIALGFVLHGASVALRMVEIVRGGPFHFSVGLSLLAFLSVGAYLLAGRGLPLLGACVAPLVVG